jgi:hypothetical protein
MKTNLLCQILECWYLDINFLDNLLNQYNIELDIDDIRANFWKVDVNILIYETFEIIKNMFIEDNQEEIESLWIDINNIDYQIYCNYIDSHLRFNNNQIDDLFNNWRK